MKSYSSTDVGKTRQINQDCVFCTDEPVGRLPNLYIVADGMGGHNAGDFASKFCVETFIEQMKLIKDKSPIGIMGYGLLKANEELINKATKDTDMQGMGTTCVAATIMDGILYVANVGDSRLYIINDSITQITEDHSLVEEMVRSGEIARDEMRNHPNKNIITRAIGANTSLIPDYFEVELKEDDIVLMCSDGLTNMVDDKRIQEIIVENRENLEEATNKLINIANANGGKDNISLIIIKL